MSITVITVGGLSVNLVALPAAPGLRSVEFKMHDSVAASPRSFTGQMQVQAWPGADMWSGTLTLPPLTAAQADVWEAALMQLRGIQNAFQIGNPLKAVPRGTVAGTPVVHNATTGNLAMAQALGTSGWTASAAGVLLAGDYMQVGYRLYRVLDDVTADSGGLATIPVWPSLREVPANGSAIVTASARALVRLADNDRSSSADYTKLTKLSFQFMEYR